MCAAAPPRVAAIVTWMGIGLSVGTYHWTFHCFMAKLRPGHAGHVHDVCRGSAALPMLYFVISCRWDAKGDGHCQFMAKRRPWECHARSAHAVRSLDVGKYPNPSFGPFHKFLVPYQGFFSLLSI